MADNAGSHVYEDEIDLLDYWRVLVKHKKLIGAMVGLAFLASLIISLLLPKTYASTASVLPPQETGAFGSGLMSQLPTELDTLAGGILRTKSASEVWAGILKSQNVRDAIIERFNLREIYEAETIEDTRKALDKRVHIEQSKEGIVSITVEDRNPERAADLANAFVEELDRVNKEVVTTSGKRMRVFLEKRLISAEPELAKAEEAVKVFQEKNKAVKLDDQSKAIIEAIGTVKGQLMTKEVELHTLLSYATPTHPQVGILRTQVEELRQKLRELEEGEQHNPVVPQNIFIPTDKIPDLALQYARLLRNVMVQETLFKLLTQQYEMARIQEAKDSPTVQILDYGKVPEKKAKPKRTIIVLLSTFAAGFFGIFLSFFSDYLSSIKEN